MSCLCWGNSSTNISIMRHMRKGRNVTRSCCVRIQCLRPKLSSSLWHSHEERRGTLRLPPAKSICIYYKCVCSVLFLQRSLKPVRCVSSSSLLIIWQYHCVRNWYPNWKIKNVLILKCWCITIFASQNSKQISIHLAQSFCFENLEIFNIL